MQKLVSNGVFMLGFNLTIAVEGRIQTPKLMGENGKKLS